MRYLLAILLALFMAAPALAGFSDPGARQGGFKGPGAQPPASTVSQARGMRDDARVTLTGNIVSQLPSDHDKYIFRDATGEITVEIDQEDFRGQNVTPANTVRIIGEVDKEFGRAPEIDVKYLEVLN
ncbi:MAG: NirD/YgiW/YdeI family stress tolerance protein [Desulfovibrio sp.]|nr:NirD/YgiW/YdeI family stress tolerance protein [Desulfovibrio sp.]